MAKRIVDGGAYEEFFAFAGEVIDAGRLRLEARYVQHGTTSTLLHSIAVAFHAEQMARRCGHVAHINEIRRAGLLHDYYLYDWHDRSIKTQGHATHHAARALANALEDYPDLTALERDAIRCHMFPINPTPPCSEVGWCITAADKRCALHETVVRSGLAYPIIRLCMARYLPDVDLGVTSLDPAALLASCQASRGLAGQGAL